MSANKLDQRVYWNEMAGPIWVDLQPRLDRQLAPLGLAAMDALDPKRGEAILDVGCGAGDTSLELASRVGANGRVTGLDISAPLLGAARRRGQGLAQVQFLEADAASHRFEGTYDAIFSRFGVMFFSDPGAAFANLRTALKPGGRLAFVCWRAMIENPYMTLPFAAAQHHFPPLPPAEPNQPGPYAFADRQRLEDVLTQGGFKSIEITAHDSMLISGDLDNATYVALRVGPLGSQLREFPDKRDLVVADVRRALADHMGPDGVAMKACVWIAKAQRD